MLQDFYYIPFTRSRFPSSSTSLKVLSSLLPSLPPSFHEYLIVMSAVNFEIKSPKLLPSGSLTSSEQTIRKLVNYTLGKLVVTE